MPQRLLLGLVTPCLDDVQARTVATVVWKSLQLAGADPRRVRGWGRLFDGARA